MESTQGGFLLLGLVLLLNTICTVDGSLRPASVAEIRDVLVWGPHRDIRKEVEDGILLPPVLPAVTIAEEAWVESKNLVHPVVRPRSAAGHLFHGPLTKVIPPTEVTSDHKDGDAAPMPYVESSQFRRTNSQVEFTQVEIFPATKKFLGKPTDSDGPKAQFSKASRINKFTANRKASEVNPSTTTEDRPDKSGRETPSASSLSVLSDELSDPFGRLPSNEEYDRNSRFTHSILYGFNADF
uniref:Uncharacterized protein n=1 Tax=Coptotermes formosanus TaxID=36987 RepID=R4V390_COPFO|nr:hypothetical protein [Coptotermes formosanus]